MTPPYPIHSVELRQLLDLIDPPYWGLYSCDVLLEDGSTIRECSVQSDGFMIAYETLEDDLGNALLPQLQ